MKKVISLLLCILMMTACAFAEENDAETLLLTFEINDIGYVLGETAPDDLAAVGWPVSTEEDGTFVFATPEGNFFYAKTDDPRYAVVVMNEDGTSASPIVYIDLMWADDVVTSWNSYSSDPEEGTTANLWDWLVKSYGAQESDEGYLVATIRMSGDRSLTVETDGIRVRLYLGAFVETEEADG